MRGKVVHDKDSLSPLARWLVEECEARKIPWAEGSRRAGVSQEIISKIVRGVYRPALDVCRKLAEAFDRPLPEVMQLAGLTAEPKMTLKELVRDVEALPPAQKAAVLQLWRDALVGAYTLLIVAQSEAEGRWLEGVDPPSIDIVGFGDDEEEAEE